MKSQINEIRRMQKLAGIGKEYLLEDQYDDLNKAIHVLSPRMESWDTFLPWTYNDIRAGALIGGGVVRANSDPKMQKKIWDAIDKPALVKKMRDITQTENNWKELYAAINKEVVDAAAKIGA